MNQLFVKFNAKKFSLIIGFSIHTAYTVPWIDPDVIRTRNLLIWSQTRYHCATGSYMLKFKKIQIAKVLSQLN